MIINGLKKHIHVACALIERDGLVLAAQRGAAMSLPHKWEFPGGKLEAGESPEECLLRELVEEMGVAVIIERALPLLTHGYDTFTVTLYPFVCTLGEQQITLHEHATIAWLPPRELHTLDWLEADRPLLDEYLAGNPLQDKPLQTSPSQGRLQISKSALPEKGGRGVGSASAFFPYNQALTERARENRKNPTAAESRMWCEVLRMKCFESHKFLRQKPIDNYIVDFYCSELRLVIEIDGDSHAETVEYDEVRTEVLEALGLTVVRYTNHDVMNNLAGVYDDLCRVTARLQGAYK